MDKNAAYKIIKICMNLTFIYFILLAGWVYYDSKERPELYSFPVIEKQTLSPYSGEVIDLDKRTREELLQENKDLKDMYFHWIYLFKTFVYPMFIVLLLLYIARLAVDNLERIKAVGDDQEES